MLSQSYGVFDMRKKRGKNAEKKHKKTRKKEKSKKIDVKKDRLNPVNSLGRFWSVTQIGLSAKVAVFVPIFESGLADIVKN